jgi:Fic family protein
LRRSLVKETACVAGLGKASASAARLHDLVTRQIVFTIPEAAKTIGVSEVTLGKATTHLERLGIVAETTGRARNRVYVYDNYLRLLQDDEPVAFA